MSRSTARHAARHAAHRSSSADEPRQAGLHEAAEWARDAQRAEQQVRVPQATTRATLLTSLAASFVLVCVALAGLSVSSSSASSPQPAGTTDLRLATIEAGLGVGAVRQAAHAAVAAAQQSERIRQLLAQRYAAVEGATRAAHRVSLAAAPGPAATPTPGPTAMSRPMPAAPVASSSATAWADSPFAVRVANCESGGGPSDTNRTYDGNPHLSDPNGHYGKWQFAPGTWAGVGGTGNPAAASESEQDYRAWLLWKQDGWTPWQCASLV